MHPPEVERLFLAEPLALKARRIPFGKIVLAAAASNLEAHIQTFCSWHPSAVERISPQHGVSEKDSSGLSFHGATR